MIDLSTPEAQTLLAQEAARQQLTPQDLAGWCQVASLDDARAILNTAALLGQPVEVSTFDRAMAAARVISEIVGIALPVVGMAQSLRTLFST